jgi:type IV secretion system protein VirB10
MVPPMSDYRPPAESPVFARARSVGARVAAQPSPWGVILPAAAILALGVFVFLGLQSASQARNQTALPVTPPVAAQAAPVAAPAQVPAPPPPPPPARAGYAAYAVQPPSPLNDPAIRWRSPALVVDFSTSSGSVVGAAALAVAGQTPDSAAPPPVGLSPDEQLAASSGDPTRATQIVDIARTVPQGTVIPAVLETAVNSDLPGFARAVVSRDVRGFDGTRVLIPRGSKLIGQYRSGVAAGQTRAFVVWTRILTPDGVSIDVGSPAADPLGRGGVPGEANSHFFRRFGTSILLSVLTGGLQALAAEQGGGGAIIIGSPAQASQLADIALKKEIDIPTTITVPQGEPIRVFVARDLDFSGVALPGQR